MLVSIYENTPDKPTITGPSSGKPGELYEFSVSTIDPDDDPVFYLIDWYHDNMSGWLGPIESGDELIVNHVFPQQGTYYIKAKAKDVHGQESTWSETLKVSMPKNNVYPVFFRLFEQYPHFYSAIQQIIQYQR